MEGLERPPWERDHDLGSVESRHTGAELFAGRRGRFRAYGHGDEQRSTSAMQPVTVHAKNGFVFYSTTKADNEAPYFEFVVVQMDGTGAHAVACRQRTFTQSHKACRTGGVADFSDGGADSGLALEFLTLSAESADFNLDTWEGPAGTPSRGTFQVADLSPDAGTTFSLLAATSGHHMSEPPNADPCE